jgi:hypothetical protein
MRSRSVNGFSMECRCESASNVTTEAREAISSSSSSVNPFVERCNLRSVKIFGRGDIRVTCCENVFNEIESY